MVRERERKKNRCFEKNGIQSRRLIKLDEAKQAYRHAENNKRRKSLRKSLFMQFMRLCKRSLERFSPNERNHTRENCLSLNYARQLCAHRAYPQLDSRTGKTHGIFCTLENRRFARANAAADRLHSLQCDHSLRIRPLRVAAHTCQTCCNSGFRRHGRELYRNKLYRHVLPKVAGKQYRYAFRNAHFRALFS